MKPVSTDNMKPVSTNNGETKTHGLFEFVRALKSFSARRINELRQTPGTPVRQSRFYDRIIRDENELHNVRHLQKQRISVTSNEVIIWERSSAG